MEILIANLLFSTLIFGIAARMYLVPKLGMVNPKTILLPILLLHAFRHLGLMFLAPGAIYKGIPQEFAIPAAWGDFLAAILALISIVLVVKNSKASFLFLWIFNIEGSLDLLAAIFLATFFNASPYMGPAYWIPAFWVPALLVSHYLTFMILLQYPTWKTNN